MNIVPEGGAQSAPVRPRGAFGGPPRRRGGDWGRKAVLAMKALTELDPRYRGNFQQQQDMYAQQDALAAEEARKARFNKTLENIGMGDLAGFSPEQMSALYGFKRDGVADERYADQTAYSRGRDDVNDAFRERSYSDGRSDRAEDVAHRADRANAADTQWAADHGLRQQGLDIQRQQAEAEAAVAAGPDVQGESTLRKEFLSQNKGFQEVQRAYERVKAVDTSNAAGQMGLIFQYMKMLDPGSTVREGEFATAQNTTGIPGAIINAYNKARAGEFLNPDQVRDFRLQADNLYAAASDGLGRSFQDYRSRADQYSFDGARTIPDLRGGGQVPSISGDADYDQLPPGSEYIGTDSVRRRKPA